MQYINMAIRVHSTKYDSRVKQHEGTDCKQIPLQIYIRVERNFYDLRHVNIASIYYKA